MVCVYLCVSASRLTIFGNGKPNQYSEFSPFLAPLHMNQGILEEAFF